MRTPVAQHDPLPYQLCSADLPRRNDTCCGLWHDDANGQEAPAGSHPMWRAKNLEKGSVGDYVTDDGFTADTELTGTYVRTYDSTPVAPWLRNAKKKVFLSTEDE